MSTTTTKLGLIKAELSDPADITKMNPNWDKVDETLGNLDKINNTYTTLEHYMVGLDGDTLEDVLNLNVDLITKGLPTASRTRQFILANSKVANSEVTMWLVTMCRISLGLIRVELRNVNDSTNHTVIMTRGTTANSWSEPMFIEPIIYGTDDIEAGSDSFEPDGTIHFVIE